MKRSSTRKETSRLINVWMPLPLISDMDEVVFEIADSDRSKFIRLAVRDRIAMSRRLANSATTPKPTPATP